MYVVDSANLVLQPQMANTRAPHIVNWTGEVLKRADCDAPHRTAAERRRLYTIPSSERDLLTFIGRSVDIITRSVEKLVRLGVDEACGLRARIQLSSPRKPVFFFFYSAPFDRR